MATITVGLPFHDALNTLADAIRSVFAQTFRDWELLLVDDGSSDGSTEIARAVRDPRVRVLVDGARRRLPARLNQIAREARAPLVARLDADDMMHPDRLEKELRALEVQASADFVGTGFYTIGRSGELGVMGCGAVDTHPRHVLRSGLMAHATLLVRRAWLLDNPYDERCPRAEDLELYCRTLGLARFEHLPEPLYFVRRAKEPNRALEEYVEGARDNRRLFVGHGVRLVGWPSVIPLVLASLGKELAFRLVTLAGMQHALIDQRGGRPLSPLERAEAEGALARVRATRVPGLSA